MVKSIMPSEEWQESKKLFHRGGKDWYILHVNPVEEGGLTTSIEEMYDHKPTKQDKEDLYNAWLDLMKREKIQEVTVYDVSENVNSFEIDSIVSWLPKADRVGLRNSLTVEQTSGHVTTTLYLNGHAIVLPISSALAMLDTLELYAIECYRTTEQHKAAIQDKVIIEQVENYDYTTGYPQHPVFNSQVE